MLLFVAVVPQKLAAQTGGYDITSLQSRVSALEHRISNHADAGAALMLFGAFCALWAQNTGRNAWLWFFLGAFFSVITVLVLLYKNSQDRQQ